MLRVDSRKIEPGDTFIAIKSVVRDGHDYIGDAIDRGAACIICQHGDYKVKTIIVPDTKAYLANYLSELYCDKLGKLKIIGITGTHGKATSAYLIYELLNKLDIKTGYIGSLGFYLPEKKEKLSNTSFDLYELYELLSIAADNDVKILVLEVSSQDLDMRRVEGLNFEFAIFTNLTDEQLEYHHTMEEYKQSMLKLFRNVKNKAIINIDDKNGRSFVLNKNDNVLLGKNNCDYVISDINLSSSGSIFKVTCDNVVREINLPILGAYNIYNYMNAYIIADLLHLDMDLVLAKTNELVSPPGRYQIVKNDKYMVIIDYAHTPLAVMNLINSVRNHVYGKVITIIGCGGDRDKSKRPIMGKVATDNSDYVIFTTDNPRTENPEDILKDITNGLKNENFEIVLEREAAIKKGIGMLLENDVLLVLGKGHEEYQIIGKDKFHLSDFEEVKKYVK